MPQMRLLRHVLLRPKCHRSKRVGSRGNIMAKNGQSNDGKGKRVTRYSYDSVMEPRTPETGHTALLPADEQVVTVPMDNGWTKAVKVLPLASADERPVVVDMDPAADPTLFWSGKRSRREVPILPLQ